MKKLYRYFLGGEPCYDDKGNTIDCITKKILNPKPFFTEQFPNQLQGTSTFNWNNFTDVPDIETDVTGNKFIKEKDINNDVLFKTERVFGETNKNNVALFSIMDPILRNISEKHKRNKEMNYVNQNMYEMRINSPLMGESDSVKYGYNLYRYGGIKNNKKCGKIMKFEDGGEFDELEKELEDELLKENEYRVTEKDIEKVGLENDKKYFRKLRNKEVISDILNTKSNIYKYSNEDNEIVINTNDTIDTLKNKPLNINNITIDKIRNAFAAAENSGNADFSKYHGKYAFGPYGWMDTDANHSHFREFFDKNVGGLKTTYKTYKNYKTAAQANNEDTKNIENIFVNELLKRNNGDIKQAITYNLFGNAGVRAYKNNNMEFKIGNNMTLGKYLKIVSDKLQ